MIGLLLIYVISIILCILGNIYRYNMGKQEIESMTDNMYKSKDKRKKEIADQILLFGILGFLPIVNTLIFLVIFFIQIIYFIRGYIEDSL